MAPTIKSPTVVLPPPSYSYKPFFSPAAESTSSFFETSEPSSPICSMERSIRKVMSKYGAGDLHGSALLPSYRCLRRRKPQEENQAVAVTHDDNTYKIMLDVRDFAEGSVSVRALGENELVVEGIIQKKEESSPSENCQSVKSCSRSFQQRFMFPGLQVEGVTSSVSSDGVLTVTAPRIVTENKAVEFQMPVTKSLEDSSQLSSQGNQLSSQSTQLSSQGTQLSTGEKSSQVSSEQTRKLSSQHTTEQTQTVASSTVQSTSAVKSNEHIVPIQVEEATPTIQSSLMNQPMLGTQQKSSTVTSSSNEQQLSESSKFCNQSNDSSSLSNLRNVTNTNQSLLSSKSMFDDMLKDSLVPIENKGLFFQDSFFENSRRYFQDAVNQVMRRADIDTSVSDPLNWYQSHRTSNLFEDSRAGTIKTEDTEYKIVLDVKDFEEGSVNVRAVGDSEILVEGKVEKKTEGTSISRQFRRRFVLPGKVKCEAITSALSADGVLTITAPKQEGFKIVELTGQNANMTKTSLTNSSIFGPATPSCGSPNISVPPSSVTSPTGDLTGSFQPVFSKVKDESQSSNITQQSTMQSQSSVQQQKQSNVQSSFSKSVQEETQKQNIVPIALDQTTASNSNEKIVNINFIDKNQKEIDALDSTMNNLNRESYTNSSDHQQYQLIGTVKDLSDVNLKETVKQRKSVTQSASSDKEIAIKYDDLSGFNFPIVRRGPFYQDSFFNGVHQNFQSAIRQVLDRWVDVPSLLFSNRGTSSLENFDGYHNTLSNYKSILDCDFFDDLTCYKSLRHRSLKEENQASTVKENTEDFKIVLDVHGFSEKDISIRASSHNELVVEGCVQTSSSGSQSSHKFKRQFILPGPVRLEAVHAALSADDVLTITVPKNTLLRLTH